MAWITGKTLQGNCGAVTYTQDGHYLCGPVPDHPGIAPNTVDPINFYVCIYGQEGEKVDLDIQWPRFEPDLGAFRKYSVPCFFTVAHRCVYTSTDAVNWKRIEPVSIDSNNQILHISLTLEASVSYVSVNYFYTCQMYAALRAAMAAAPCVQEVRIGTSRDGQAMYLYRVTDPEVPAAEKKLVYLQGAQHCCEYGGPHLLDAMLRYLTGGTEEAGRLLKKYEFHITPVVSVADWAAGYKDELITTLSEDYKDSNTVWDSLCTPETRAVDAYLRSLPQKPAVLMDLHNARSSNFLILPSGITEEEMEAFCRFNTLIETYCDYMAPGKSKYPKEDKYANFKQYALKAFGFGVTMEISRFGLYDRKLQRDVPLSRESFARLASQLAQTIDVYLSDC